MRKFFTVFCALTLILSFSSGQGTAETWISDSNGCKVLNRYPTIQLTFTWSGKCSDGYADGHGVIKWVFKDTNKFFSNHESDFVRGKSNGKGTDTFIKSHFEGDFVEGKRNGKGTLTYRDGGHYEGDWVDDQKANGIEYNADGTVLRRVHNEVNLKQQTTTSESVVASAPQATTPPRQVQEPLSPEEQTRYEKVLTTGRPAQIYALAVKMGSQNRNDLAEKLFQALIDRFPDDAFAVKAIDKMEATQKAAQQQLINQQQQAGQVQMQRQQLSAMQQANEKKIANCKARCDLAASNCQEQVNRQNSQAVAGAFMGMMGRNSSATMNSMNSYNDTNACDNNLQSCYLSCQ